MSLRSASSHPPSGTGPALDVTGPWNFANSHQSHGGKDRRISGHVEYDLSIGYPRPVGTTRAGSRSIQVHLSWPRVRTDHDTEVEDS